MVALALGGCSSDDASPALDDTSTSSMDGGSSSDTSTTSDEASSSGATSLGDGSDGSGSSGGEAPPALPPEVEAELHDQIEQIRLDAGLPGLAVGFTYGPHVVWTGGFGEREVGTGDAVQRTTPFRVASVSKTVVGVALARAAELDLLGPQGLDAPVELGVVLDNPHLEGETITYRHLAQHSAGLDDTELYECAYVSEDGGAYFEPEDRADCPETPTPALGDFLAAYLEPGGPLHSQDIFASGPSGEPGARYRYSNIGAAVAASAIDHHSDGFETLCQQEIFEPLSMSNTAWHRSELSDPEAVAMPHAWVEGAYASFEHYALATYPDGGLYASAQDMARFLATMTAGGGAFEGVRILDAQSAAALIDVQEVVSEDIVEGQGLFWEEFAGGLIGHTGGDPGVATAIAYDPGSDVGGVVLINASGPNTDIVMLQVLGALRGVAAEHL